MARIAGIDLPREKRVEIGLTYIFHWSQSRHPGKGSDRRRCIKAP